MPARISEAPYRPKDAGRSGSDLIDVMRRRYGMEIERAVAGMPSATPAQRAKRADAIAAFEAALLDKATHFAVAAGVRRGLASKYDVTLRRPAVPAAPGNLVHVEALAKALGLWTASSSLGEAIADPHAIWSHVFTRGEEIRIFSHTRPSFWTADRLRVQFGVRARMLVTGSPKAVRRILVLPDAGAAAELACMVPLLDVSAGAPTGMVSPGFAATGQLAEHQIQTRWIRTGPLVDLWQSMKRRDRSAWNLFDLPPVSSLAWEEREPAGRSSSVRNWLLDGERNLLGMVTVSRQDGIALHRAFFEAAWREAAKRDTKLETEARAMAPVVVRGPSGLDVP